MPKKFDKQAVIDAVEGNIRDMVVNLGLNLNDPSLENTPKRVSKMFVNELFRGLYEEMPCMTTFPNEGGTYVDQILMVKDITFQSTCAHHFLPFIGKACIAYLPGMKILGLSKFNRYVQWMAARPSVQEQLTQKIGEGLSEILETDDIAVITQAKHLCCNIRGVKDPESYTTCSYVTGSFRASGDLKQEYLTLLKLHL